ncbi:MAG: hypothetical protein JW874_15345 [Spirochaetales bacterium]|nr:hypothetical protein [Spirochaetales bacterium]
MHKNYPYAFVTFIIKNDSYLPGALLLAYSLKKQNIIADLICIVSEGISEEAAQTLECLYDHVIRLPGICISELSDRKRQYLPWVFTRLHALRLGGDGDLGFQYEKVIILDADILPLRGYQQLFLLDTPAGILNESRENVLGAGEDSNSRNGTWGWHSQYRYLPHGIRIPKHITDRVIFDNTNFGINTALLIVRPSLGTYTELRNDLDNPKIVDFIRRNYRWPDMQFLTLKWSGFWHNVDISYASFHGYPDLQAINGNHYIGVKPWQTENESIRKVYAKYEDFQYWYTLFLEMLDRYHEIGSNPMVNKVRERVLSLQGAENV